MLLKDKNIILTGCQQGIGLATMEVAAREGANIFACCQSEREEFLQKVEQLEKDYGVRIMPLYFDLCDEAAMKEAVKQIQKEKLPIHGLANIAGMTGDALFAMIRKEQMEKVFQVNLFSQILLTQYVVRLMQRTGGGSIVNVSSVTAMDGNPGQVVYAATKAAWLAVTKTLSQELGSSGIRVNAVAPGVIESPMTADLIAQGVMDAAIARTGLKRPGTPEDVAEVIVFLLSDKTSYTTGQTIRIDGGIA